MNTELTTEHGPAAVHQEKAAKDFKEILGDTGHLLKDAGCSMLQEITATRIAMTEKVHNLGDSTYQFAKEKPLAMMGVAAATGLIIGTLIGRR